MNNGSSSNNGVTERNRFSLSQLDGFFGNTGVQLDNRDSIKEIGQKLPFNLLQLVIAEYFDFSYDGNVKHLLMFPQVIEQVHMSELGSEYDDIAVNKRGYYLGSGRSFLISRCHSAGFSTLANALACTNCSNQ
jgi:hypothetical protein